MTEQGWIVAPKRRDKKAPSFTKGVTDCYTEDAVYVFPVKADAVAHLSAFGDSYAVFEVKISVVQRKS